MIERTAYSHGYLSDRQGGVLKTVCSELMRQDESQGQMWINEENEKMSGRQHAEKKILYEKEMQHSDQEYVQTYN